MIFVKPVERCSPDKWSPWFRHRVQEGWMTRCRHREPLTEGKSTPVLMTYLMYSKGSRVKLKKKRKREILLHFAFSASSITAYLGPYKDEGIKSWWADLAVLEFTFVVWHHPAFYISLFIFRHIPPRMSCLKLHVCVCIWRFRVVAQVWKCHLPLSSRMHHWMVD